MKSAEHPDPVDLEALLADRLRGVTDRAPLEVPAGVDEAIRARLRAETARAARRPAGRVRRLRWVAAAAAATLLLAGSWRLDLLESDKAPVEDPLVVADPRDVDRSGGVDIVDAYLVARRLGRGEGAPSGWDVNRDGSVDRGDVELIARAAVSLEGRPR